MSVAARFVLSSTGRVSATLQAVADAAGSASVAAQAYATGLGDPQAMFVTTDTVAAGDSENGGWRRTVTGQLRVYDATAGLPANSGVHQGVAMTEDGQVCYTTATSGDVYSLAAVSVDELGRVYMDFLSFVLPLSDDGAGAVDLVPTLAGDATPTFTRATTATTVLSTGLIAAVGSGVARSWYDPTTLVYGGYLAEGARTNLCLQSEDYSSASWTTVTDTTITADAITSPDGAVTADLLTEGSAGTAVVGQAVTATANVVSSQSRFIRRGNHTWVRLELANGANFVRGWFNLLTGAVGSSTVGGTGVLGSISIKAYPNEWYRCTVNGNLGGVVTAYGINSYSASADVSTVRVSGGTRYEWGAQFEDNSAFASSYIPTTTAAVVRNADVLTYPTAGNMNVGTSAGSWYAEVASPSVVSAATRRVFFATTAAGNNRLEYRFPSDVSTDSGGAYGTGAAVITLTGAAIISGTVYKLAGAYGANGGRFAQSGVLTDTNATASDLGSETSFGIGCTNTAAAQLFGTIKNVLIWTSQVPNAALQVMTDG